MSSLILVFPYRGLKTSQVKREVAGQLKAGVLQDWHLRMFFLPNIPEAIELRYLLHLEQLSSLITSHGKTLSWELWDGLEDQRIPPRPKAGSPCRGLHDAWRFVAGEKNP